MSRYLEWKKQANKACEIKLYWTYKQWGKVWTKNFRAKKSSNYDWCVKNGELKLDTINNKNILSGNWQGLIPKTKSEEERICSPGIITVKKEIKHLVNIQEDLRKINYENQFKRKIRIDKIIRANSKKITIKIWDLFEDGDIISLYLNGEQVLKDHHLKNEKLKNKNLFKRRRKSIYCTFRRYG